MCSSLHLQSSQHCRYKSHQMCFLLHCMIQLWLHMSCTACKECRCFQIHSIQHCTGMSECSHCSPVHRSLLAEHCWDMCTQCRSCHLHSSQHCRCIWGCWLCSQQHRSATPEHEGQSSCRLSRLCLSHSTLHCMSKSPDWRCCLHYRTLKLWQTDCTLRMRCS